MLNLLYKFYRWVETRYPLAYTWLALYRSIEDECIVIRYNDGRSIQVIAIGNSIKINLFVKGDNKPIAYKIYECKKNDELFEQVIRVLLPDKYEKMQADFLVKIAILNAMYIKG
jgi:hypothetical protein